MDRMDDAAALPSLPFRVYGLEAQSRTQDAAINHLRESSARTSEAVAAQAVTLAKHDQQLRDGREDIVEVKTDVAALAASVTALTEKVATGLNRVAWVLTGFAFTVAGTAITLVITNNPS